MDTGLEKIMTVEIINQRPDPEPLTFSGFMPRPRWAPGYMKSNAPVWC